MDSRERRAKEIAMQITERAKEQLRQLLEEHPGKCLRLVFEGFG